MNTLRLMAGRPYLLLTLTALIWAGNTIAGKLAVGHISPFLLTSMRWGLALVIVLVAAAPALRRDWPAIVRHWPFLAALAAMGFTLFNSLFYVALHHTSAIHAAIEQAAMPLFVFALNFVIFRIPTSWLQATGYGLTLMGVVLTVTGGDPSVIAGGNLNIGDLYMIVAVIAYALFSVLLGRKPAMHWLSFIAVLVAFAFLTSIPGALWELAQGEAVWPDGQGWAVALYTALLPSLLAQAMWIRGVEIIGSNRGGVFINLVPIFAVAMAVVILGEAFRPYHAAAMVLVIFGLWLAQRHRRQ
ncbi:MAG: membrane protein [Alphaproteobacteria bacterium]|nr:MAG: membrane protein [Alphaproteobacteria bacterium]